jgi:hypothetical protein
MTKQKWIVLVYLACVIAMTSPNRDEPTINWNRLVWLHGHGMILDGDRVVVVADEVTEFIPLSLSLTSLTMSHVLQPVSHLMTTIAQAQFEPMKQPWSDRASPTYRFEFFHVDSGKMIVGAQASPWGRN